MNCKIVFTIPELNLIHHDNGILGAATWEKSEWRRVRIMKEAGFIAIRSSHNPASEAMLRACDAYDFRRTSGKTGKWLKNILKELTN